MKVIRMPTALRGYVEGKSEIQVQAGTVGEAIDQIRSKYPAVEKHLFTEEGDLRAYVNLFLNDEDVRGLQGMETELDDGDRLMIVPSIAGGRADQAGEDVQKVDHNALRTNQASIIALLMLGFVVGWEWMIPAVGAVMLLGALNDRPGFFFVYRLLRRLKLVKPDRIPDHPQPHRFAQGLGGITLALSSLALQVSWTLLGWVGAWIVIGLAGLNLFLGFCVGCALYYWFNRLGFPGFSKSPPRTALRAERGGEDG